MNSDVFSVNDHIMYILLDDLDENIRWKDLKMNMRISEVVVQKIYVLDCFHVNTFDKMVDLLRTTYTCKFQKKAM